MVARARVLTPLLWNFARWLRSRLPFPEGGYGSWKVPLTTAAEKIHRDHPVDLVVGSANPNVDFAPGMHLRRKYKVPYAMDYRDTWHLNVYSGKTIGGHYGRSRRMERKLVGSAAEVWFVNQPIRDSCS